jgi:Big-like domain-containing protein
MPEAPCDPTARETAESGHSSDCGCKPAFTIEKRQEIAGSGSGFTASPLTGAIDETVDYKIIVENTGVFPETFSEFTDLHCDPGTLAGGPGASSVAPGESTTYTCSHLLTAAGRYTNEATVTGISFVGVPVTHTSNQVVVEVPSPKPPPSHSSNPVEVTVPKASVANPVTPGVPRPTQKVGGVCEASPPILRGASGPKSGTFTAQVKSAGIKQITFYLDGRKLKTLRSEQARRGTYSITINPRSLAYGQHKLSVKTLPADVNCAAVARTGVFVHPRAQQAVARFAG